MQTTFIVYGIIVCFFSGLITGITAFGFALVAIPLLMLFFDPKAAVPIVTISSALTGIYLFFELRKRMQVKKIIPLIIGGIIGLPFGVYILVVLDKDILKISVGALISVFAVLLALGIKKEIKNEKNTSVLIGMVSGLLKGSTSLSGPPVVLFLINQDQEKEVFRANLTGYFMIMGTLAVIALDHRKTGEFNGPGILGLVYCPDDFGHRAGIKDLSPCKSHPLQESFAGGCYYCRDTLYPFRIEGVRLRIGLSRGWDPEGSTTAMKWVAKPEQSRKEVTL